jgi:hypothetical protein
VVVGALDPDTLHPGEALRPYYHQAIRISGMHPNSRLTALTMLGYAHHKTGLVSRHLHSDEQLAGDTALSLAQVRVHLEILRQRGWLELRTLSRGDRVGQQVWQVRIPGPLLQRVRAQRNATTD